MNLKIGVQNVGAYLNTQLLMRCALATRAAMSSLLKSTLANNLIGISSADATSELSVPRYVTRLA